MRVLVELQELVCEWREETMKLCRVVCRYLLSAVCIAGLGCSTGPTGPAGATGADGGYMVVYQQGVAPYASYSGCSDTRLTSGADSAQNWGASSNLFIGSNATGNMRFLIRFDLDGLVPATATVDRAYLTLHTGSSISGEFTLTAYPVTWPWDEGSAVVTADSDDGATWIQRTERLDWVSKGGDYDSTRPGSAVAMPDSMGAAATIPVDPGVAADWVADPAANHGVLVIGSKEGSATGNFSSFLTSEYSSVPAYRPRLTLFIRM